MLTSMYSFSKFSYTFKFSFILYYLWKYVLRINFKLKQHQYLIIILASFPIYCLFNININKEPSISEISEQQLVQRYPIRADSTNKSHFWHKLILDRSLYLVMDPPLLKIKGGGVVRTLEWLELPPPIPSCCYDIQSVAINFWGFGHAACFEIGSWMERRHLSWRQLVSLGVENFATSPFPSKYHGIRTVMKKILHKRWMT